VLLLANVITFSQKSRFAISWISVSLLTALLIACSPTTNKNLEEMIEINENQTFSENEEGQWKKGNGWMPMNT